MSSIQLGEVVKAIEKRVRSLEATDGACLASINALTNRVEILERILGSLTRANAGGKEKRVSTA